VVSDHTCKGGIEGPLQLMTLVLVEMASRLGREHKAVDAEVNGKTGASNMVLAEQRLEWKLWPGTRAGSGGVLCQRRRASTPMIARCGSDCTFRSLGGSPGALSHCKE
jgi:hypothetical protein